MHYHLEAWYPVGPVWSESAMNSVDNLHLKRQKCIWICRLLQIIALHTNKLSIEANSVDPEQTALIGAVWSGSTLFAIEAS